jgi:hypothetical protein
MNRNNLLGRLGALRKISLDAMEITKIKKFETMKVPCIRFMLPKNDFIQYNVKPSPWCNYRKRLKF